MSSHHLLWDYPIPPPLSLEESLGLYFLRSYSTVVYTVGFSRSNVPITIEILSLVYPYKLLVTCLYHGFIFCETNRFKFPQPNRYSLQVYFHILVGIAKLFYNFNTVCFPLLFFDILCRRNTTILPHIQCHIYTKMYIIYYLNHYIRSISWNVTIKCNIANSLNEIPDLSVDC